MERIEGSEAVIDRVKRLNGSGLECADYFMRELGKSIPTHMNSIGNLYAVSRKFRRPLKLLFAILIHARTRIVFLV